MWGEEGFTIMGAGHQGLAMAAHLTLCGEHCYLWNRTPAHIQEIMDTRRISCHGIMEDNAVIDGAGSDLKAALRRVILVTTPSSAHEEIAKRLAPYVRKDQVIILNPGRTFGALSFLDALRMAGARELPVIAETQTIVYTCRRSGDTDVTIFAMKDHVPIAAIRSEDTRKAMAALPKAIAHYFCPAKSVWETSFSNVGLVLHCAPVLLNIGWIESKTVDFKYYYQGISPSIATLLERIDQERLAVAQQMGTPVESLVHWLQRTYGTQGTLIYDNLQTNRYYEKIDAPPTLQCRYLDEDVPNGLVPLEDCGRRCGVPTPMISMIIDLASAVRQVDYRKQGRKYHERWKKVVQ